MVTADAGFLKAVKIFLREQSVGGTELYVTFFLHGAVSCEGFFHFRTV